jgi:hypothetical protein
MDLLWGKYMLLCGQDGRAVELPDLFTVHALHEGVTGAELVKARYFPTILYCLSGFKKNTKKGGISQYGVAFRNKTVERCPVEAMAFWFYFRWHMAGEPVPNFADRGKWYKTKVLSTVRDRFKSPEKSLHGEACDTAYRAANYIYLGGTHTGHCEAAKHADTMLDIPDAQMRRLGRWDHSRMTKHYSIGIPK